MTPVQSFLAKLPEQPAKNTYDLGALLRGMLESSGKYGQHEFAVGQRLANELNVKAQGVLVPTYALLPSYALRELQVGTGSGSTGGKLVATELRADRFIDLLRNRSAITPYCTSLSGLVGNVVIPRQTGGGTAYWVAESGEPTESAQTFDQVTMSPKTVGAYTDISRKLILQSTPQILDVVKSDLAASLALAIDSAAINGTGSSNQPTGILATSGISETDLSGATLGWSHVVNLETTVAQANVDEAGLAYLMHPSTAALLRQRFANDTYGETPLLSGTREGALLNGRKAIISNQVPTATLICGNMLDLIVGQWGVLDIMVDPYSMSTSGGIRVVVQQDIDVCVRHPQSFAVVTNFV